MNEKIIWPKDASSPFTIGEMDEDGNPLITYTVKPGEEFPPEAVALLKRHGQNDFVFDDKGNFTPEKLKKSFKTGVNQVHDWGKKK